MLRIILYNRWFQSTTKDIVVNIASNKPLFIFFFLDFWVSSVYSTCLFIHVNNPRSAYFSCPFVLPAKLFLRCAKQKYSKRNIASGVLLCKTLLFRRTTKVCLLFPFLDLQMFIFLDLLRMCGLWVRWV